MDRNRLISLGIIGAIVAVAAFGWLLGVSPVLEQTSAAQAQQLSIDTNNQSSEARLLLLKKQFQGLDALKAKLASLRASVPENSDIPTFLAEINALTASAGVSLTSLTIADAATFVDPQAPAEGAAAPATGDSTPAASPSPSPSATAATGAG
jgi:Tfp pilus assembly protein PilO